jgi:integrase
LHLPLLLALWTGQRQGDLLRLSWSAYDGTHIRLRQSKTGARVVLPVGTPLKAALDAAKKHRPLILTNSLRRPWTSHGFQASWRIAATKAGIVGVTFHDLRGTAVTRLAIVGCTEAEIASITGAQPARRAPDPRRQLPAPRSRALREEIPSRRSRFSVHPVGLN